MKPEYLRIDPTACAGHGLCAELVPEMVQLDEWGYPIIDVVAVAPRLRQHAQRAVSFCPTLALSLRPDPATGRPLRRATHAPAPERPSRAQPRG
ncbi:MAG: ferredoxin [Candidatus Dormiibacterota bacterium]